MKAVYVGRFQPLHQGHYNVVEEFRDRYENFLIAIGSSGKERSREDPLSFEERKEMIKNCFPDVEIIGIEDVPDDGEWVEKLEQETGAEVVLTGNNFVEEIIEQHGSVEVVFLEKERPEIYSSTEVRRRIRSGEEWSYLVPGCAEDTIREYLEAIQDTGIEYEYRPGWKKENASHGKIE